MEYVVLLASMLAVYMLSHLSVIQVSIHVYYMSNNIGITVHCSHGIFHCYIQSLALCWVIECMRHQLVCINKYILCIAF